MRLGFFASLVLLIAVSNSAASAAEPLPMVDAASFERKLMCGYQGWFRCPGDAANMGWVHWSRNSKRLAADTLTFEMWPDLSDFPENERFAAPGFTHPDGKQAYLFSSDNETTVRRHFEWMRDYGIDGAYLQHFVVDLPGGPSQNRYASRRHVMEHVRKAAVATGRVWAIAYDIAGMPGNQIYDTIVRDWKKLVDDKITADPRYLHQGQKPVVQIWGFFWNEQNNAMTVDLANKLIDFFKADGPYAAYLVGGGSWDWRRIPDKQWLAFYQRFDAYMPWNVGNISKDADGVKHASMNYWADDIKQCQERGINWVPVVYPGFGWDNLRKQPPGSSRIARRKGAFFWEQFHELAKLKVSSAYIAMFDEVDEGTAIFKVDNSPPTQAHFVGYEDLPSDWYLRLAREGGRMLRGERARSAEIPIKP